MIQEAIKKIIEKKNLTEQESSEVMKEIMSGKATDAQISCFITALRMKKETIEEITGLAKTMREFAKKVKADLSLPVLDTCGTGGDGTGTFNISTLTAVIAAASGIKVAKHGNRSVSSKCGSADLFEALGVKIDMGAEHLEKSLEEVGITFLFAVAMHPAMKYAIGPRKEIAIRTVFNILGPLTNPACANCQVLGVYNVELVEPLANVLKNMGHRRAFVVHGEGLDEFTITGETTVAELSGGKISRYKITPEEFGIKRARLEQLKGSDIKTNIEILYSVLKGEKGPRRDVVLLNASAAIVAGEKASDLKEGLKLAAEIIDSGKALKKLEQMKEFSKKLP